MNFLETQVSTNLEWAIRHLQEGSLVAIPTETVYGLAGNALNHRSILNIFEVKNRPQTNPLILHVPNQEAAKKYLEEWPEWAERLSERFWPGPLTLLLKKNALVDPLITAGHDRVAIRVPSHRVCLELLEKLPFPLVAPSANPFSYISPTTADHVYHQLRGKIPMILDGGACVKGLESTIVGLHQGKPAIYRAGAIPAEHIESVLQMSVEKLYLENSNSTPTVPGSMLKHYAPGTPLILTDHPLDELRQFEGRRMALLLFSKPENFEMLQHCFFLSEHRDLEEAASRLYAVLQEIDRLNFDGIIAEKMPGTDLGNSINDRLWRASQN